MDEGGERSYPKVVAQPEPTRVRTDLFFSMARDAKRRREKARVARERNRDGLRELDLPNLPPR